jgi:low temperature requirement protein LtrA
LVLLITSLLFIVSILLPAPWRFVLWGLAVLTDMVVPLAIAIRTNAAGQEELHRTLLLSPSVVERFGLFTIIVLGEVIVGVVSGVAGQQHLSGLVGGTAVLGMVIAIGLWWIYFDFVSGRRPIDKPITGLVWIYLHLPVAMGIAIVGASMVNAVEHAGEPLPSDVRWLLAGAITLILVAVALIMRILDLPESYRRLYQRGSMLTLIAGIVAVALGVTPIGTIPLLLALSALLLVPVACGLVIWIKVFGASELEV